MVPSARILDGRAIAARVRDEVANGVAVLKQRCGVMPHLHVVLVGDDEASRIYVRGKSKACEQVGIRSVTHALPESTSQADLLDLVTRLNADPDVDGILVQMPLPAHMDAAAVMNAIDPGRDVDGFHPLNLGRLLAGQPGLVPCTPAGILRLIDETGVDLKGRRVLVVGRSLTVGKPVAILLSARHATVTLAHSRTEDLASRVAEAEVLVAAIGKPEFIRGNWIRPGAIVIDVGMNREQGRLCGDVEFAAAAERAAFLTPVPGGVGPMTIAYLLHNTLLAAEWRREKL